MRIYSEQQLFSIKTICGGILYDLFTYNKREVLFDHWLQLSSYLGIDQSVIYSIEEVTSSSFLFKSQSLCFRYHHDDWSHSRRIIEFIPLVTTE